MKFSASPHRPLHLYTNEMWYFITAPTYQHNCILLTNAHFHLWIQALKKLTREFQLKLKAWVVLPNHYIHYNPIKHGYVREPEEREFSSYCNYLQEGSKGWLTSCREEYPLDEGEDVEDRRTEVRVTNGDAG